MIRTYNLVDYHDVWERADCEGTTEYTVNDVITLERGIKLDVDNMSDEELIERLVDFDGIAWLRLASYDVADILIEGDPEFIEFFDRDSGCPLGRLEAWRERR